MTAETLFTNAEPFRFKIIRPVYETLTVNDQAAQYQDAHLSSSREVVSRFDFLGRETQEHFWAVHLDSKNKLLCLDQVSTCSLNASIVHPKVAFTFPKNPSIIDDRIAMLGSVGSRVGECAEKVKSENLFAG